MARKQQREGEADSESKKKAFMQRETGKQRRVLGQKNEYL
jgi:hypothetical protein